MTLPLLPLLTIFTVLSALLPPSLAFDPGPDAVDFYYDPLMPREGDALILEAQLLRRPLKRLPKQDDYHWYYREMESSPSAYRHIGTGANLRYEIPKGFYDGYFNLTVLCCCTPKGEMFQLESAKLIRIQRPLRMRVLVDRRPLLGNHSEMILPHGQAQANLECRIWGMPTRFQLRPPVGVACGIHKTRTRKRYVSVLRRKCSVRTGPLICSASNDVSRVTLVAYIRVAPPGVVVPTAPPRKMDKSKLLSTTTTSVKTKPARPGVVGVEIERTAEKEYKVVPEGHAGGKPKTTASRLSLSPLTFFIAFVALVAAT